MGFYKRAFRYVTRKKGKSLLLLLIMALACSMLFGGVSLLQNVQYQRQVIEEKSQAKISISAPDQEKSITPEKIAQVEALENVAWVNRISSTLAEPSDFELAPGAEDPQENKAQLYGYDDTSTDGSFSTQLLRLESGTHLDRKSSYAVLLHHDLAQANSLSLGDNISFQDSTGKSVSAIIQGIYLSSSGGEGNQKVSTPQRSENQIYVTQDIMQALQPEISYEQVVAYLKSPKELQNTQGELETFMGDYQISAHDAVFKRIENTLAQTEKSVVLVLILTALTAAITTTLLLCMWARERTREFAILLSLGNTIKELYLQVYTELALLFTGAIAISIPLAHFCLPFLNTLLSSEETEVTMSLQLPLAEILLIIFVGFLVLALADLLALLPLTKSSLKTLLSRAD